MVGTIHTCGFVSTYFLLRSLTLIPSCNPDRDPNPTLTFITTGTAKILWLILTPNYNPNPECNQTETPSCGAVRFRFKYSDR